MLWHLAALQHAQKGGDQVLAEGFQFVVNAGELRLAAMDQHGIIVS